MICKAKWQPLNHEAKFGFSFGCCVRGLGFFKWGSKYHTPAASVREWQQVSHTSCKCTRVTIYVHEYNAFDRCISWASKANGLSRSNSNKRLWPSWHVSCWGVIDFAKNTQNGNYLLCFFYLASASSLCLNNKKNLRFLCLALQN